jgi:uncharacterized protein
MKTIYLIHRWDGNPSSDWYPWIKKELESKGFKVEIPEMPNTAKPQVEKWTNKLKDTLKNIDEDTYFIGHSIGCQAIMRYLEQLPQNKRIGGAVFVAGWFELDNLESEEEKSIAKQWLEKPIDFSKLKDKLGKLVVILSSNEPYGCVSENSKIFRQKLGAEVIIEKEKGHFTEYDKIKELPIALNKMLEMIK